MKVISNVYGEGNLYKIKNGVAEIKYENETKKISFPMAFMSGSVKTEDPKLLEYINDEKMYGISVKYEEKNTKKSVQKTVGLSNGFSKKFLNWKTEEEFYDALAYLSISDNVNLIAEVPNTEKIDEFEKEFPGELYSPINVSYNDYGTPTKISAQFRIKFNSMYDVPEILRNQVTNDNCINKTSFVRELVTEYGFHFGKKQNITEIQSTISKTGYLPVFNNSIEKYSQKDIKKEQDFNRDRDFDIEL